MRMRRGSNNEETPKGVPSSKNNRQIDTCRPFRVSCMRTKPNSYRHGNYRLGSVYRQGSKTLFHAYGPRSTARVHRLYINEDLTRAEVVARARQLKRDDKLDNRWTRNGYIFVKNGVSVHRITAVREIRVLI